MPQSGALAPYVVVNRDAAVAGVFSVDGLRGSVDLTTKYLTIANFNAYKTTTDGSISSINQSITALNTAVSNKAAKGANSDITSITGLTTALGIAYGGTGGKTAAEARTNLGLTTAATTSIGTDGARIPLLNGVNTWATNQTFSGTQTVFSNVSPGGIEIGSSGTAGIAYIDLHSSGTGNDYDVRILSDGGTNTVGRGTLSISAALVKLPALELTSPLGVAFGGTGASSIEGARTALGISNFSTIGTSSSVYAPSQNHRLVVNDAGVWGVVKTDNTWIALPIAQGGTGATNASSARTNLGLGSAATKDVGPNTGNVLGVGYFGFGTPTINVLANTESGFYGIDDSGTAWAPQAGSGIVCGYGPARRQQIFTGVSGNLFVRNLIASAMNTSSSTIPWTQMQAVGTSDINFKKDITELDTEIALANIDAMEFVSFRYKDDDSEAVRRGVIAQQIEKIDPEYVHSAEGVGKMTLDLNPLLMDALAAIKTLNAKVAELSKQVDELKQGGV